MPTASRENSRTRQGSKSTSKAKSPPPQPQKAPVKKINGVKNNHKPTSTKDLNSKLLKDPKLFDLLTETECRLCEKKNFKQGSDVITKHYALEHFKDKLDAEIGINSIAKDFSCTTCKNKKLKSKFDSRQDILLHNAIFHFRVQLLLAESIEEKSSSNSASCSTRSAKARNREKLEKIDTGKLEEASNDSVIEIDTSSGSNDGASENGVDGKSSDNEIEEIVDIKNDLGNKSKSQVC